MKDVLNIVFDNPFSFIGTLIVVVLVTNVVRSLWIRFMRMIMVTLRGWPPSHLDADGDWKPEPEEKEEIPVHLNS